MTKKRKYSILVYFYFKNLKLSKIKGLRKRINGLIFKQKFPEQQEEIKVSLVAGTQACLDVRNSEKFQKLLEVLLLVGNFMNSGSSNLEGSIGFDIKFLPKVKQLEKNHLVAHLVTYKLYFKLSSMVRKPTITGELCFTWLRK